MHNLASEMQHVLQTNILPFWMHNMTDAEHGGFYGEMTGSGVLNSQADKGAILNARILWTFSAAYRVLKNPDYLTFATRAKDYILQHFVDHCQGGVYWKLNYKGDVVDDKKQFYALGFALYGMAEYARATKSQQALDMAWELFDTIERHGVDSQYGGYIEALSCSWQPLLDVRLSELDANFPKSQNTHLHIIEPYTNLYRAMLENHSNVAQIERVGAAIRRLITIFCEKIINPTTHHLDLFFEMDWTRGAGRLESYGHDIECSWLLHEAALLLGDNVLLGKVEPTVISLAEASMKGLHNDGSMIHEANLDTGQVDTDRHWWVQAETVVGFYNIYQHFDNQQALDICQKCWNYIKEHLVDHQLGEWFWSCNEQGEVNRADNHAGFWKCPYHNSRMCLEIIERSGGVQP